MCLMHIVLNILEIYIGKYEEFNISSTSKTTIEKQNYRFFLILVFEKGHFFYKVNRSNRTRMDGIIPMRIL